MFKSTCFKNCLGFHNAHIALQYVNRQPLTVQLFHSGDNPAKRQTFFSFFFFLGGGGRGVCEHTAYFRLLTMGFWMMVLQPNWYQRVYLKDSKNHLYRPMLYVVLKHHFNSRSKPSCWTFKMMFNTIKGHFLQVWLYSGQRFQPI